MTSTDVPQWNANQPARPVHHVYSLRCTDPSCLLHEGNSSRSDEAAAIGDTATYEGVEWKTLYVSHRWHFTIEVNELAGKVRIHGASSTASVLIQ